MPVLQLVRDRRVPHSPGVYLMKNSKGTIIYIGKAKDLYKRVSSYFLKSNTQHSWKTSRLVSQIADLDFVITDNEIEAFLLESNLIKRYRPIFNIELKDQQRYTYLKITDELFPRLLVARRNRNGQFLGPKGSVYGPFVRGSSKLLTVGLMRKLFKIRICDRLPKSPCLQYYIKNCDAPCINKNVLESYISNVNALRDILEGKKSIEQFLKSLEFEMRSASDSGDYERAKEIRDTLFRLDNLKIMQKMERAVRHGSEEEYFAIARDVRKGVAHVMSLRRSHGVISDRKKFEFELVGDNSLDSFIVQYYSSAAGVPDQIYLSENPDSVVVLQQTLERMSSHRVKILAEGQISNSDKRALIDLIMRNLDVYLERGHSPAVIELKRVLNLKFIPEVIDCFDISNLGLDISVGACCRFVGGKPSKAGYRKFKIKTVEGQNDFAMIKELVTRRYSGEESQFPDLVVIDGGKGQLSSAVDALVDLGVELANNPEASTKPTGGASGKTVECIAIAKENEDIFIHGKVQPISIEKSNEGLRLVQHIRDEAHRFGLAYNRQLRRLH